MDRRRRNRPGFTLVELMIVVAILGLLFKIVAPRIEDAIRRSQEARTKGNLAEIRAGINLYKINNNVFPAFLQALTNPPNAVIEKLPLKYTPPYHPEGNTASNGTTLEIFDARGDWFYFNDPSEPEYGSVVVNCTHADIKGRRWQDY